MELLVFLSLSLTGFACLAASFHYRRRRRSAQRQRSRTLFMAGLLLLTVAALWGWL